MIKDFKSKFIESRTSAGLGRRVNSRDSSDLQVETKRIMEGSCSSSRESDFKSGDSLRNMVTKAKWRWSRGGRQLRVRCVGER